MEFIFAAWARMVKFTEPNIISYFNFNYKAIIRRLAQEISLNLRSNRMASFATHISSVLGICQT